MVGSRETAEDLLQETFLRAYRTYDGYDEVGKEKQWLCTITRNVCLSYLGRAAALPEVSLFSGDGDLNLLDLT
ncbi:MAG TPA: RNA polymerase sigma factor [Firmicutes bacterium]|nr:RNA polymerase sigma factor [Bacillota bacterium]